MLWGTPRAMACDAKGTERRGAQEIFPTTPVTRTADSTGIPGGCVSKLKSTSDKASGELFALLTVH